MAALKNRFKYVLKIKLKIPFPTGQGRSSINNSVDDKKQIAFDRCLGKNENCHESSCRKSLVNHDLNARYSKV